MDDSLKSSINEANQLLGERKYEEIISLVQPLLIRETGGQAQRVYGMALLGLGRPAEAIPILMSAARVLPNDVTVAFAYGNAMNQVGQVEGARASFERALGIDANHPGAKMGFANASKALADRDEEKDPMKAIEWLYAVWQREPANAELANRILDIYIRNGWADSARQFAGLLPPQLKNSQPVLEKMKNLPAAAPPIDPGNIRPVTGNPAAGPVMEACPFCKQQMMVGVHTCPHCKMIIRAKAMPGADYKPEWQEVVLNILCWIGILIGAFQMIIVFVRQEHATPSGGFQLVVGFAMIVSNLLVLQRSDLWMTISKWLNVLNALQSFGCACMATMAVGSMYGHMRELAIIALIQQFISGLYSAFMVYLLNYEGAD